MLGAVDFDTERYEKIFQTLDQLKTLLEDRTLVQGILGYIWAKNDRAIPIPGAKTVDQITEIGQCLDLGPLTKQEMGDIDSLFSELQLDFSYDNFAYYKEDKKED